MLLKVSPHLTIHSRSFILDSFYCLSKLTNFSSTISNLPSVPSCGSWSHTLWFSSLEVGFASFFYSSCFYWPFKYNAGNCCCLNDLVLSGNSNICIICGSISTHCLFLLTMGCVFLPSVSGNFWLDARHYKSYLTGCWICLCSYNCP